MTNLILAALLFVVGIGALGSALFGRLRQRRLLLLALAVICWGFATYLFVNSDVIQRTEVAEAATPEVVPEETVTAETIVIPELTPKPPTPTPIPPTPTLEPTPTPEPSLGYFVFPSQRSGRYDIWVMDLDDPKNPVQLTDLPGLDVEPMWSPDGSQILFISSRGDEADRRDLFLMDADGSNQRKLLDWPESHEWGAAWSPDGEIIAFTSTRDYDYEIYALNVDGSGKPVNLTFNDKLDTYPSFSPDGKWMAFVSDRSGNWEIWKMDWQACLEARQEGAVLDERCNAIQLSNNRDDDFYPRWSPDGSQIAFESRREANRDIYIMDADGGNVTRVTTHSDHDSNPVWALDGTAIIFNSRRNFDWDMFMINVDGTEERQLTTSPGEDRFGDWKP